MRVLARSRTYPSPTNENDDDDDEEQHHDNAHDHSRQFQNVRRCHSRHRRRRYVREYARALAVLRVARVCNRAIALMRSCGSGEGAMLFFSLSSQATSFCACDGKKWITPSLPLHVAQISRHQGACACAEATSVSARGARVCKTSSITKKTAFWGDAAAATAAAAAQRCRGRAHARACAC